MTPRQMASRAEPEPPVTITFLWCPACGRCDDTQILPGDHRTRDCAGKPDVRRLTYTLCEDEPAPQYKPRIGNRAERRAGGKL